MRVDQLVQSVVEGDAISADATEIWRRLTSMGVESDVYVGETGGRPRPDVPTRPASDLEPGADALIYHLSSGSALVDRFLAYPAKRVLVYHNITPPRFFEGWDPPMVSVAAAGRRQLRRAGPLCDFATGESEFNRKDLRSAGFGRTAVLPVATLVDPASLEVEPDTATLDELAARKANGPIWMFVGRFVPNKCQVDIVKAFAAFRRASAPGATLALIGSAYTGSYHKGTLELAERLGVLESVIARGPVSLAELSAFYRSADLFVCMSEHEGFCAPLLEAMHFRVPIVAYAAAAIPETVAGAGVLLDTKDPLLVAAAADELLADSELRALLDERARTRLEELSPDRSWGRLESLLAENIGLKR